MSSNRNTKLYLEAILTEISISCSKNKQQDDYQPGVELSILMTYLKSQDYLDMVESMSIQELNG